MAWKFENHAPVYLQIVWHIKNDILNGVYGADEQIPSVRQLAQMAAVNPNTMQRALSELEAEGLLYSKGTAGRYVSGNSDVLKEVRKEEVKRLLDDFLKKADALSISKDEIISFLKEESDK